MKIPHRRPNTSIKHKNLIKLLEPRYGAKGYFIGAAWGPGWDDIIHDLHNSLLVSDPEYSIAQIKEKFATLRFYTDHLSEEGHAAVRAAEELSAITCEECGRPGALRDDQYWIVTLCDLDNKIRNINASLWKYTRWYYTRYWRIRFAIKRWRKNRNGSAKN